VLLVEDVNVVRRGLAVSLVADPAVRLVGAPRTVAEANALINAEAHNLTHVFLPVAVVGTRPADVSALEAVRGLRDRFPGIAVILVSGQPTDDELFAAIQAGAAAYLGLDVTLPTLRMTVRRVAAGEYVINEQLFDLEDVAEWVQARFRTASSSVPPGRSGTAFLTEREREVLQELAGGSSVKQITQKLDISLPLARFHLRSIIEKLAIDASDERPDPPRHDPPRDDPPLAGVPARPRGPWSPPGHLRTAVPLPVTEQK
jgi:two-component system nitrate/nitrite response regulator NarL